MSLGQNQNLSKRQYSHLKRIPRPNRKRSEWLTTPLRRSLMLNPGLSSRPCQSLCPCQSFTLRYSQRRVSSTMPSTPEPTPPVEQVRPESQLSSSNQTVTPQDRSPNPNPAVPNNTYAGFFAKDARRRKTPLLHVKPLPNNQPLPKPEWEYDSYADFYANDPRLMKHVDDRPLPALVKKEAARTADRSSRPPSSSKPPKPKLTIPAKAPVDPPRVAEAKHRQRSDSRHRRRHKAPSSFDDLAVSSNLSDSSGRLTTPAASVARSRSRSRSREHRRSSHRKSGHKSRRHSPGLSSPTPSHGSRPRHD